MGAVGVGRKEREEKSESGGNYSGSLRECHRGRPRAVSGQVGGEGAECRSLWV